MKEVCGAERHDLRARFLGAHVGRCALKTVAEVCDDRSGRGTEGACFQGEVAGKTTVA